MISTEIKENIKRHYGSSDEDLADLAAVMDALEDVDKVEELKSALETAKLEAEKALKDLDQSWRDRYRARFFDGDIVFPEEFKDPEDREDDPEDITIEEFIEENYREKE